MDNEEKKKKKGLFSKIKGAMTYDPATDNTGVNKSTYFYGILFIFLIVAALAIKLSPSDSKKVKSTPKEVDNKVVTIDYEKDLNAVSDNYELDIVVNKYYFNEYVNIKKQGLNEIINIKKHDSNNTYNQDDVIKEDIDITFTLPQNILKLLSVKSYSDENKYMIETSKWLSVYNELNGTEFTKIISGEISIEFLSDSDNELILQMDLTNLYKNLNYEYDTVTYKLKYYNIGKVNISNNN